MTYNLQNKFKLYKAPVPQSYPTAWDEVKEILPGFLGLMLLIAGVLYM